MRDRRLVVTLEATDCGLGHFRSNDIVGFLDTLRYGACVIEEVKNYGNRIEVTFRVDPNSFTDMVKGRLPTMGLKVAEKTVMGSAAKPAGD